MKIRISATIEKETEKLIDRLLERGKYRNKSHVIEESLKKLAEENDDTR